MKYLILILVVVLVLWFARSSRRSSSSSRADAPASPSSARQQPMIACAHCGLHLPRDEALPGRGGVFCGEAHRTAYEKAHPPA